MARVIFYGGSFNPVHMGHVFVACYLSHLGLFDEVLVAPVFKHPYSKDLADYHHRYEMCQLAMGWIPKVKVSDIEWHFFSGEPNYTYSTLKALKEIHPTWEMSFAVGSDNAADIKNWHHGEKLLDIAAPFVIGRAGHPDQNNIAILPELSSTEVRNLLAHYNCINGAAKRRAKLRAFLPEGILQYIKDNSLYNVNE